MGNQTSHTPSSLSPTVQHALQQLRRMTVPESLPERMSYNMMLASLRWRAAVRVPDPVAAIFPLGLQPPSDGPCQLPVLHAFYCCHSLEALEQELHALEMEAGEHTLEQDMERSSDGRRQQLRHCRSESEYRQFLQEGRQQRQLRIRLQRICPPDSVRRTLQYGILRLECEPSDPNYALQQRWEQMDGSVKALPALLHVKPADRKANHKRLQNLLQPSKESPGLPEFSVPIEASPGHPSYSMAVTDWSQLNQFLPVWELPPWECCGPRERVAWLWQLHVKEAYLPAAMEELASWLLQQPQFGEDMAAASQAEALLLVRRHLSQAEAALRDAYPPVLRDPLPQPVCKVSSHGHCRWYLEGQRVHYRELLRPYGEVALHEIKFRPRHRSSAQPQYRGDEQWTYLGTAWSTEKLQQLGYRSSRLAALKKMAGKQ